MEPTRFAHTELLNALPDAILIVDDGGRIHAANVRAEVMFGYGSGELIGQQIETLMPAAARERHVGHRKDYAGQPHVRPMGRGLDLKGRRRNGDEFSVEISLSPYQSPDGPMVVSAIRDVSERIRGEGRNP